MPRRYVPKLSREELERRRLAAGREILAADPGEWGYQARVTRRYGVSTETVSRWNGAVRRGGLDGLRATKARGKPTRLRLVGLPPYGFEYNPDEGVWDHLKWVQLRNFTPRGTEELVRGLRHGLRRVQHRPDLIASFFRKSNYP